MKERPTTSRPIHRICAKRLCTFSTISLNGVKGDVMHDWMSTKPGNTRLCDLLIPGSHDACMYMLTNNRGGPKANKSSVITQNKTIAEQLACGTRFFDIRIYKNKAGKLHAGHFAEKLCAKGKADLGAYGPSLQDVLKQIYTFIKTPASNQETVIIKFSHIHASNTGAVMQEVFDQLGTTLFRKRGAYGNFTIGNIPLMAVRGKVIAIYDKNFHASGPRADTVITYENPKDDHAWDIIGDKHGMLILRGKYANRRSLSDIVKKQTALLAKWDKVHVNPAFGGEMMQLYWTSTYNPLKSKPFTTNIEKNTRPLWDDDGKKKLSFLIKHYHPCVVLVDFADQAKNLLILNAPSSRF